MVCCCLPCFHYLQKKLDPVPGSGPFTLCITEFFRWLCIVIPLYLCTWRYAEKMGITMDAKFWGILTGGMLAISLFIYLPLKIVALRYRVKNNKLRDYRWRPSILTYIIVCALPCMVLIVIAIKYELSQGGTPSATLDPITTTALQILVFGLTVTEWMSKFREEHLTYDLITAMTVDFFFAYDVIQFIMLCTYETQIYTSQWVYVCFVFAFIAMFRYIPAQPTHIKDKGSSLAAAVCIVVSMFCVDIPFVIVRLWTMIEFGLVVSDIIHPLKNIAMICFGATQLVIIYCNRRARERARRGSKSVEALVFAEQRTCRSPLADTWNFGKGNNRVGACDDTCSIGSDTGGDKCSIGSADYVPHQADNKAMQLEEVCDIDYN